MKKNVYLGTVNGKKIYKSVYGKTTEEVETKAALLKAERLQGYKTYENNTFGYYKNLWLQEKKLTVSPGSYNNIVQTLKHLEPLDNQPLKNIEAKDITILLAELAKKNPNTGQPTSVKYLRDIRNNCISIFEYAMAQRIITYNPAHYSKIPTTAKPAKKREPIGPEIITLIERTPDRCQTAAMIMLYAGLRRGEVNALTKEDIDFQNKVIHVNKTIDMSGSKPILKHTTKTASGMRAVTMPDILYQYLFKESKTWTKKYIAFNRDEPLSNTQFINYWKSYMITLDTENFPRYKVDKHGRIKEIKVNRHDSHNYKGPVMERFTPHQLRHTYATLLYAADVDVLTAQKLLGHSSVEMTLGIYTHLAKEKEILNIEKFNSYLNS